MVPPEVSSSTALLDEEGRPAGFGWARSPLFHYEPGLIRLSRVAVSESDRYLLFCPGHLVILEILDTGFMGYAGVSVVSLTGKERTTQFYRIPLSLGSMGLPVSSETGSVKLSRRKFTLEFAAMNGGARIIKVDAPKFGHHRSLRGEVVLSPPPGAESVVTAMPWRGEKARKQFAVV